MHHARKKSSSSSKHLIKLRTNFNDISRCQPKKGGHKFLVARLWREKISQTNTFINYHALNSALIDKKATIIITIRHNHQI